MATIKIYGAGWCSMTVRSLSFLESTGVEYEYIDVEQDSAASQWVRDHNNGKERKPTIDIDGEILVEPSNDELEAALERHP